MPPFFLSLVMVIQTIYIYRHTCLLMCTARRYFVCQDNLWKTAVVFFCSQQGSNNNSDAVKWECVSNKQTRMCIVLIKELLQNTLHKYQLASPCLRIMQKMGLVWICASDGLFHGYAWPVTGVTRLPLCQTPQPPLCIGTWVVIVSRLKYCSDMLG